MKTPIDKLAVEWYTSQLMERSKELGLLNYFEWRMFSQGGEDGLLDYILKCIECPHTFIEFGAGDGMCCNTALLWRNGWSGLWAEQDKDRYKKLERLASSGLTVKHVQVTPENVNRIVGEPGVLSIDVDGNDYWLWKALCSKPAVVIIEYNGYIPPAVSWVMPYQQDWKYPGGVYFGGSFRALVELGMSKGYRPVATTLSGVNAFFLRSDINFLGWTSPTERNIWNPIRKWLFEGLPILDPGRFCEIQSR